MSWHYNPKTGIWDKYADNPYQANQEVKRINAAIARGESVGGASPEYGQTLVTLAMIPVASHIATRAVLGAVGAGSAAGAAVGTGAGVTAGAGGIGAGAGLLGAGIGVSALGLAKTGLEVGAGLTVLQWLEKNWWIPALFLGGYIAVKLIK